MINPLIVDGQVHGGVAQGIGGALLEEFVYDESGQLTTTTFKDYRLVGTTDVPRIDVSHLETPSPSTHLGTKGMGEGGAIAPGAAIAAAVADALEPLGYAFVNELPLDAGASAALRRAGACRGCGGRDGVAGICLMAGAAPPRPHPSAEPVVAPEAGGPLVGLRVIELGMILAGPFAGRLLADLGAEVIKIEAPDRARSDARVGHGHDGDRSVWWPIMARNKKCVTLNLRQPEGQELLLELVRVERRPHRELPPGTLERWNLGSERLREVNPGIVSRASPATARPGPTPAAPASRRRPRRWAASATSTASRASCRRATGISLGDSLAAMFAVQGAAGGALPPRRASAATGRSSTPRSSSRASR